MKKLFLLTAAFASMLFASCEKEEMAPAANMTTVTYTVEIPDVQVKSADTKAINDGLNATELIYEVWKTEEPKETNLLDPNSNSVRLYQKTVDLFLLPHHDGKRCTSITLDLVQNQEYTILFWAQKKGEGAYNTEQLTNVTYKEKDLKNGYLSNNENMAAFYNVDFVSDVDPKAKSITLYRPFAQLNLGTENTSREYTVEMKQSTVTIENVPTSFNVAKKHAGDEKKTIIFNLNDVPAKDHKNAANSPIIKVNGKDYQWAAMNYIFAGDENNTSHTAKVTYDIVAELTTMEGNKTTMATISNVVENVPLQENYRTNIIGNLLTSNTTYEVIVDASWEHAADGGNIVDVWNGTTISEPSYDPATMTYTIDECSELAWLAAAVNGTLSENKAPQTFAGKKFILAADLDLRGQKWTPIGYWETFDGTFDGQNHLIQNLNVNATEEDCYLGLFGCTNNATIKNLNIENATIKAKGDNEWAGGHLGVIVGYPNGESVLDNITLKGDIKVEGDMTKKGAQRIGAVVGGFKAKSLTMTNIKVDASEGSYVKGNMYVGGVIGSPLCALTMTNIESNINVYSQDGIVGGIAGWVGSNTVLTNCTASGDVVRVETLSDATENQYMRIGGIIGSWSGKVYLNGCTFTGTLSCKDNNGEDVTNFEFGGLAGRASSAEGSNQLFIDNNFVVSNVEGLQVALDYAKEGTHTIMFTNDMVGNVTIEQIEGRNFIINGNDKKFDGTITIDGNARSTGTETLTFKNINFKSNSGKTFIEAPTKVDGKYNYSHNVTVDKCTFTSDEYNEEIVGIKLLTTYNAVVKNCVARNIHSLAQFQSTDNNTVIEKVEVVNCKNGISLGNMASASITNAKISAKAYGIRLDGEKSREVGVTISGSEINAFIPVNVRKMNNDACIANVELEGENKLEGNLYEIAFCSNEYEEGVEPVAPTGAFTVKGAEKYRVYFGNIVNSAFNFDAALNTNYDNNINVEGKITSVGTGFEVKRDVVLDFNNYELNAGSDANSKWYALEIYGSNTKIIDANFTRAGVYAANNANVVFESGIINHNPERSSRYIFCALSGSTITIEGGTFKNDRTNNAYFWADAATIKVKGGNFAGVASKNKVVLTNGGQLIITGGTFNFDPTAWVAEGYEAVKSGNVWTVSAK